VSSYYDQPNCPSILSFSGKRDGSCIPTKDGNSVLYNYPSASLFIGVNDCSGLPAETMSLGVSNQCMAAQNMPLDFDVGFPYFSLNLGSVVKFEK
jgi:hypothetical protein